MSATAIFILNFAAAAIAAAGVLLASIREPRLGPPSRASTRRLYETTALALLGGLALLECGVRGAEPYRPALWPPWVVVASLAVFGLVIMPRARLTWERHVMACAALFVFTDLILWDSPLYERGQTNWLFWSLVILVTALLALPRWVRELSEKFHD